MTESRLIPVGKVGRVHGIRGAVKIYPYGESLAEQHAGNQLHLRGSIPGGEEITLTIVSIRPQGKLWIGEFREIIGIDEAKKLVGEELFLPQDRLPPASEDEYYHYQLIGLKVATTQGAFLGRLTAIIETGGNDVYVVDHEGKETLIPALVDVVVEVDLTRGQMIVDPPEGLIDDL
jgi:16S rRNA processing protein RimM